MKVELIAITKPAGKLAETSAITGEDVTSYIARVSNPSNQENFDTAPKLLRYCVNNAHWSVLEHAYMTLEVTTSLAIATQILRHRSFVFQQYSLRYAEAQDFEIYDARSQDTKNRQKSNDNLSGEIKQWFIDAQIQNNEGCYELYKEALDRGIAREQARFLLPMSTKTTIYITGNARSWLHYIELRKGHGTQKEHSDVAIKAEKIFIEQFPAVAAAMGWV